MDNPILRVDGISKRYRSGAAYAVSGVSFNLQAGELLALVGESGSGKTTLLRIIAGLEHPDSGTISLSGRVLVSGKKSVPANRRGIGLLFQDYALFPHLTIFQNIAFGLPRIPAAEREATVRELMAVTGLSVEGSRYPHELSGGQQQRVALARALAARPGLLLLDEPFSNLDTILREQVRDEVREIIAKTGTTAILVTHDIKDALGIADRIAVMDRGSLLQIGDPQTIYHQPDTGYEARRVRKFNVLKAKPGNGFIQTGFGRIPVPAEADRFNEPDLSRICFRPEQAVMVGDDRDSLTGILRSRVFCGDRWQLRLGHTADSDEIIHIDCHDARDFSPGDEIRFALLGFARWDPPVNSTRPGRMS